METNKNKKKAKIRFIGFLLFLIIHFSMLVVSFFLKYGESNYKLFISLYFISLFFLLSLYLKKIKSIVFIFLFLMISLLTKSIFLAIKLKTFYIHNILLLINYNYYLNLLNSFMFSFLTIYVFNLLNLNKKVKILMIPQIIINNIEIKKSDIKKMQISRYIAGIIYKSYKEFTKIIN